MRIVRPGASGEAKFIAWIRRRAAGAAGLRVGIGDDAAVVDAPAGGTWVATVDMLLEGAHFDLARATPRAVGRKAMNVNVSDIAAMGCVPRWALVAVGLGRGKGSGFARALARGVLDAARAAGVAVVGGDTNVHAGGLAISITLLGEAPRGTAPFLRSGARPGDALCVTGALGGSILGRHLRFVPRVATALALRRRARVHAMIDVSDGLSTDLGHLLDAGGVGAHVAAARIPIHPDARRLARRTRRPPLDHALHDGEDFELLFTVPDADADRLDGRALGGARVTRIGTIVRPRGAWLFFPDGRRQPLRPGGYQHELDPRRS